MFTWNSTILYTNDGIPERFQGFFDGFQIRIRPSSRWDEGLEAHEREHERQASLLTPFLWLFLYEFSLSFRLWAEVKAFRSQYCVTPYKLNSLASFLSSDYGLSISLEEAVQSITSPYR